MKADGKWKKCDKITLWKGLTSTAGPGRQYYHRLWEKIPNKMWQHVRKSGRIVMAQYSIELLMGLRRRAILPFQLAVMSSKTLWTENDVWQQKWKGLWTTKRLDHDPCLARAWCIQSTGQLHQWLELRPTLMGCMARLANVQGYMYVATPHRCKRCTEWHWWHWLACQAFAALGYMHSMNTRLLTEMAGLVHGHVF